MKTLNGRTANYFIEDLFLERYSPRAFSGEPISKEEIMTLFEAARWAPSASNRQPWRFVYAMHGTPEFDKLFSFLVDFNRDWCHRASALVVTVSKKTKSDGSPNPTHSFDAGAAWENLALQARKIGLIAHGMSGLHYDLAKSMLGIPDDFQVEMMIAIGKPGNVEELKPELQPREKPSDRKPLDQIVAEGMFNF